MDEEWWSFLLASAPAILKQLAFERDQAIVAAVMAGVDPAALPPERRPRGPVRACLIREPIIRLAHRLGGDSE